MKEHLDAAVAAVAARQHSLVTVAQARDLGATRQQLRSRLRRGQWIMADSSVIRLTGAPVTWESKVLTAVLGAGPAAVASHRTAAALWRLEGCRRGMPEISIPRGRTYRRTGVRVHQSTDLDRTTPIVLNAIPTTRGPRALLDLGAVVTSQQVHLATDDARRRNLTNWPALLDTLVAHARPGRDGVGILRAILDAHFGEVAVTDSGFERLVAITLCEAGLPPPSLQYEVSFGRKRYRFDLAYPDRMIGIELDGSTHLVRAVWEADHGRQNALVNAGWTVLRFTWRDYTERRAALIHTSRPPTAKPGGQIELVLAT